MNKKAQYYPKPTYSFVHPILIVGIVIFCIPFLLPIAGIHPAGWVKTLCNFGGVGGILIGAIMSMIKAS